MAVGGDFPLAKYDAMCRAIAEAHAVDEVKDIRDKAQAIEIYSRQARNFDNEVRAIEIRIRAERRVGELLAEMDRAQGKRSDLVTSPQAGTKSFDEQLGDYGISRNQSRALAEARRGAGGGIRGDFRPVREAVDDRHHQQGFIRKETRRG